MKISVIIVTFNASQHLKRCVNSIFSQTYSNLEVIVKDAGSTDSTIDILSQYKDIKLVQKPDTGIYDAMNQAMDYVTGDIFTYLNSDDFFSDEWVLERVAAAFNQKDIEYIYANVNFVNSDQLVIRNWNAVDISQYKNKMGLQVPHPGMFMKYKFWITHRLDFDPSLEISADFAMQQKLFKIKEGSFKHINEPLVFMQIGGKSTASFSSHVVGFLECLQVLVQVYGYIGLISSFRRYFSKLNFVSFRYKIFFVQVSLIKCFRILYQYLKIRFKNFRDHNLEYLLPTELVGLPLNKLNPKIIDNSCIYKSDTFIPPENNTITALMLITPARFGNLYIQVSNLITIGIQNSLPVYLPKTIQGIKIPSIKGLEIKYYDDERDICGCLRSSYFYSDLFFSAAMKKKRQQVFADISKANFKRTTIEKDTVVVHIRSGDIFSGLRPNPNYSQPPISFYYRVLRQYLKFKIYLVTEDGKSPVLEPLANWLKALNVEFECCGDTIEDAHQKLLQSDIIISSRGTFLLPLFNAIDNRDIHVYGNIGVGGRFFDLYGNNRIKVWEYSDVNAGHLDEYWINSKISRGLLKSV